MRRRDVIRLVVLAIGAPLAACGGGDVPSFSCGATSRTTEAELSMRLSQQYVDQSSQPDRLCSNCRYYTPAPAGECGACQQIRGPIHPDGYCVLWTATG